MDNKVVVVLPCHNQEDIIKINISLLRDQTRPPDKVVVVDDHSDSFSLIEDSFVRVVHGTSKGRSTTRNLGISTALEEGADILVFMDGDSVVEDELYIERLLTHFQDSSELSLIFGTRIHTERPLDLERWVKGENVPRKRYQKKPSDLLTANMDNLMVGNDLDYRDLRVVANVPENYAALTSFDEKADFILTGMVTWACNFAMTAPALRAIQGLMERVYGLNGMWFDEITFRTQWGYEDVAFGLDALFAGVDVQLQDDCRVIHFLHGRSDDLFVHIQGKHLIMNRYRELTRVKGTLSRRTLSDLFLEIDGRTFLLSNYGYGPIQVDGKYIRIGKYVYDWELGDFKKESLLRIYLSNLKNLFKRKDK